MTWLGYVVAGFWLLCMLVRHVAVVLYVPVHHPSTDLRKVYFAPDPEVQRVKRMRGEA